MSPHNPCSPDCLDRSATCHPVCPKYKVFKDEMEAIRQARGRERQADPIRPDKYMYKWNGRTDNGIIIRTRRRGKHG